MLSVVIPAWSGTEELADMAYKLAQSVRLMCDELVITEDGEFSTDLCLISDIYLQNHPRLGHARNLSRGFDHSTGNFVALIDSDIKIEQGTLRDLCMPETIVYPEWNLASWEQYLPRQGHKTLAAWFLVAPRSFIESFPPYAGPGLEGIDEWGRKLSERFPVLWTNKLTYSHEARGSYGHLGIPNHWA